MTFLRIVRNYENICKLGHEIMKHKQHVRTVPREKLGEEFLKQEKRIDEFMKATESAHKEWNKSQNTVNPYWTGLS